MFKMRSIFLHISCKRNAIHIRSTMSSHMKRFQHNERKINVCGDLINFVETGCGEKSLLLMPGALGSAWTDFEPQIKKLPALLPDYTIIAWDPPGYGKSIPPKRKFDLDFYENDAATAVKLMENLKRPKFSILGWSDGGITGLIAAGRFKNVVDKLVIWGAGAYVNKDEIEALKAIRDVSKWSARMREPMEKVYGVQRFAEIWGEWVDTAVCFYEQKDGDYCRNLLANINASIFIIHGKKDPMLAPEHVPFLKKQLNVNRYHEFPEGKHNIHLRYADEFNKIVTDFLQKSS